MSEVPGDDRLIAGRYRLLGPLGQGGMGVVWRARDEVLGREVAVKEVRAPSGLASTDIQRLYARLEREAWAAARVSHRNVVTVYDVATEDSRPWIVMELIRGLALSEVLDAEGPMTPQRAARIGAEVLAALRSAHASGVLHRDVKPGNVLLANDGRVVLTDFGIAMVEGTSALTMTGELIGSPEFLAPERALGRTPGPESDLWSLGVLLYAATEGNSPFRQNTPLNTLRAVVDEELPPPRRAGPLAPVIEGLLRKDPAERLSAEQAEHQLRIIAAGGAPRATGAGAPDPYGPTMTADTLTPRAPLPVPPPPSPDLSTTAEVAPAGPPRRAVALLAVGLAVLLLAVGGIVWTLADRGDDGDTGGATGSGQGATGSSAPHTTPAAQEAPGSAGAQGGSGSTDDGDTAGKAGNGGSSHSSTSKPPPQTVTVYLTSVRGSYEGSCPPPHAYAPAVEATVTVGRTPAEVEYRWVLKDGTSSDAGWQSLSFGSGDGRAKQVSHTELTYQQDSTYHGTITLEVRSPVAVTSNGVEFSVTCRTETPSNGASYPAED
ncbi:serine/threonine-protein kinase [Streptomyces sp. NBC_01637]|uniref:serine/threonine-protein kinase n=1 Tax=unclassified Streptomyces TaxID=2593676 RepID=UPI0038651244|nr:serine/threonine protein kinase [Streptomyces sp. NBC_01653]WTD32572.1 serine/threonine protein kinase [Streptomyces sp. NBC_01643]WTD88052.1 serine/threonine protein kinase [Streptomyces sp. NBC_01637]